MSEISVSGDRKERKPALVRPDPVTGGLEHRPDAAATTDGASPEQPGRQETQAFRWGPVVVVGGMMGAVLLVAIPVWFLMREEAPVARAVPGPGPGLAAGAEPADAGSPSPGRTRESSPLSLAAPPSDDFVRDSQGRRPETQLRLVLLAKKRNKVVDEREWWGRNRLEPLTYTVPNAFLQIAGDLPATVPANFLGLRIVAAVRSDPVLAIYGEDFADGRYLLAADAASGRIAWAMDFSAYQWPRRFEPSEKEYVRMATRWAALESGVLYVSHAHDTYARSSRGDNAYISALDAATGTLLWRSRPLVSNAGNFIVKGDAIISGYGFTGEKDSLYVLNRADGRIVRQVPLDSAPEVLAEREGKLFVRTYNTDYVFQVIDP